MITYYRVFYDDAVMYVAKGYINGVQDIAVTAELTTDGYVSLWWHSPEDAARAAGLVLGNEDVAQSCPLMDKGACYTEWINSFTLPGLDYTDWEDYISVKEALEKIIIKGRKVLRGDTGL